MKLSACVFCAAVAILLAGCGHKQDAAAPGGGPDPQEEQTIQRNAASQAAAIRNNPPMETVHQGATGTPGIGANHP